MKLKLFANRLLWLLAGTLWAHGPLSAQDFSASETPAAEPAEPMTGVEEDRTYLRTWFMADPGQVVYEVKAQREAATEPDILIQRPYAYQYAGYRDLAPGRTKLTVQIPGEPPRVVEQWQGNLRKGRFYTLLIRLRGSGLKLEVIDDSKTAPPPEKPEPGAPPPPVLRRLFVYQFIEDQTVKLSIPSAGLERQLPPGTVDQVENLPVGTIELFLNFRDTRGQEVVSETDFSTADTPSCSLLLIRDPYGRVSPRLVPNGQLD